MLHKDLLRAVCCHIIAAVVSIFCGLYYICRMAIAAHRTRPSLFHATHVPVNFDITDVCCLKHVSMKPYQQFQEVEAVVGS